MYLSLLPQFITLGHGSVLTQSVVLGAMQISVSLVVNVGIAVMAGSIAGFLASWPGWVMLQRCLMGGVLTGLAMKIAK